MNPDSHTLPRPCAEHTALWAALTEWRCRLDGAGRIGPKIPGEHPYTALANRHAEACGFRRWQDADAFSRLG